MQGSLMRHRLTFLLAAGGLGLSAYAGLQWRELPRYSEQDLQASTELNLQIDLARSGATTPPDAARMDQLRKQERAEVQAEIDAGRDAVLRWLAAGLALLVLALGQQLSRWLVRKR